MTTVEAHSCLLNMHVTFDLAEIEELMPRQARKQLEAELEKSCCSLGGVRCLYTAILVSPVQSSPVHGPVQSRVQVLQRPLSSRHVMRLAQMFNLGWCKLY